MDNINIRRNRRSGEVERLRMWTDTEFVSAECLRFWIKVTSRGSAFVFAVSVHLSVASSKGYRSSSVDNIKKLDKFRRVLIVYLLLSCLLCSHDVLWWFSFGLKHTLVVWKQDQGLICTLLPQTAWYWC